MYDPTNTPFVPSAGTLGRFDSENITKDQKIYGSVYTAIIERYLAPGTKLPEDTLAETFNVSRTIIRKVLLSLSHEGLVTIEPKRGAKVSKPTTKEGREVFGTRNLIEVAAIPVVVNSADKNDIKNLRLLVKNQKEAQEAQDYRAAIRLSGEFHLALMLVTRNQTLIEILRSLISKSSLIVAVYGSTSKTKAKSCQNHGELIDLIQKSNIEESQAWMQRHLDEVEESLDFGDNLAETTDLKKIFTEIQERH